MSQLDQINELNSETKCRLGVSKIHGVGVFAIQDIKCGDKLGLHPRQIAKWYHIPWGSLSKLYPEVKEIILDRWPSVINGSEFLAPNDDTIMLLYVNHSEEANYLAKTDQALIDIKKGQEIVEDYRLMANWQTVFPWLQTVDKPTLKDKLAKYLKF